MRSGNMKCPTFIHMVILLSLSLGLTTAAPSPTSDWACYKGSPERIGSSDASAPDTCYLLWELDVGPKLFASPVIRDGKVFQVGLGNLYCADLETGEVLWVSVIPVYQSTPFLTDKEIIVATDRGISALSVNDGSIIWEYVVKGRFREVMPLRDYIISSPAVSDDMVVVGTMNYYYVPAESPLTVPDEMYIVCLDEETGEEQWYVETTLGVRTSPCMVHQKVFAASREMLCINLKTGDILWDSEHTHPYDIEKPVKERFAFDYSTPALFHGLVIAGSSTLQLSSAEQRYVKWQKIVFMDQYTGDILWEWVGEGVLASSPAVYDGRVYLYSLDGMVRCLSLLEGKELWQTRVSEPMEFKVEYFRL